METKKAAWTAALKAGRMVARLVVTMVAQRAVMRAENLVDSKGDMTAG